MQAVRRLYLYVMSGITLGVVAYGLVLLVRVLLDGVFPDAPYDEYDDSRQRLSQAIAMLGVGGPVWAVHWWLVQRGLREGRPERDAERGSGARAVYITFVLIASLVVWVTGATAVLQWLAAQALIVSQDYYYGDPLGAATTSVVGFLVWLYHGLVRRRDLAAGPVRDAAAAVPRVYLYGVSIGALLAALTALDSFVPAVLPSPYPVDQGGYTTYYLAGLAINAGAWALVWFGHWTYATRLSRDPGWRGTEERVSRTRLAAFVVVIVASAAATLTRLASAIGAAIMPLLPAAPLGLYDPAYAPDSLVATLTPLLTGIPWALAWLAHSRWLRREPAAADALRALHQRRLVSHGVSAAALAIGATGAGWLLGYLLDLVFGGQRTASPGLETYEIALRLPAAVVGLTAWWWCWRRVVARRRADPIGEAGSTIRRTFLYLTLGVGIVAAIAAAAVILYRFVGIVLGAGLGGNLVSEISTPLGVLVTAGAILAYHGLALRSDLSVVASAASESLIAGEPDPGATTQPATLPAAGAIGIERREFVLVGPAGALDAAVAVARAALPPGVEIVNADR